MYRFVILFFPGHSWTYEYVPVSGLRSAAGVRKLGVGEIAAVLGVQRGFQPELE